MKRLVVLILLIAAFSLGLSAQPKSHPKPTKFDQKLEKQLKTGKSSDSVKVIIQTHDLASLPGKLSNAGAKNVVRFGTFPGMAAEITAGQLAAFSQDAAIDAISSDEPIETSSALSGTEAPNSSSGAFAALKFGSAGAGVGVAIIDSGISTKTPVLPNIVYSKDFTSAPAKDDPFGHGTHVAGIVGNSGEGPGKHYAGVAPSARLIDLRVLDSTGAGTTSSVIAAIDWAIANRNINGADNKPLNIRVINLSLGHGPLEGADTDPLALECRKAVQAGIVVVAAAGNYGKDANGNTLYGGILSPGIEPSVITVGAVTTWGTPSRADDVVASYSSRGPTIDNIIKPDLVAPGSRIVSVTSPHSNLITRNPQLQINPNYMGLSGTSMAAPEVSGTVAMILSKTPGLTPNAVKAILMYTAEKRGSPLDWGAGYLNVVGAMELAASVNPAVPVGTYWLKSSFVFPSYDLINGYAVTWGQTICWDESVYSGNSLNFNKSAWSQTIVWGETIVWDDTIVWGETIVWDTSVSTEEMNIAPQTIVWDETIVWDDTIVWDEIADDASAQ